MVAAVILLHPEVALSALLGSDGASPFNKLLVDGEELIIDLISPRIKGCYSFRLLNLLTGLLHVVHNVAE